MDKFDVAGRMKLKIEWWKSRLDWWFQSAFLRFQPNPLYWVYTSIDREVIGVIYGILVIGGPTYLSAHGHVLEAVLTAFCGTLISWVLRRGRRKRRREELVDEVIKEVESQGPRL